MGWSQILVNSNNNFDSSSHYYIPIAPAPPSNSHHLPSLLQLLQHHEQLPQPYSAAATAYLVTRKILTCSETSNTDNKMDQYKFCTPDNKRVRVLLRKMLKNSDVGSLGRIVLPKREAKVNLPTLYDKEGIHIVIKHVYSNQVWTLRYKFWCNNKSRIYVLENTGDFAEHNRLEIGDSFTLYEDESNNLHFSIIKAGMDADEGSYNQHYSNDNNNDNNNNNDNTQFVNQSREQQEPKNIMTLPMDVAVAAADKTAKR